MVFGICLLGWFAWVGRHKFLPDCVGISGCYGGYAVRRLGLVRMFCVGFVRMLYCGFSGSGWWVDCLVVN